MSLPIIDEYVVVEKLGSGSYATVYKAFSKKGKREVVAIKCIERSLMKGSAVDNLISEIRLLKTLKHRHIVLMKDFQWDDKHVYIVMEYCNAGDLSRHLKRKGGVPEGACRQLMRQLASALQELTARGIAHMDLKPQNLLLHKSSSCEMILKVADFGFAQYMSEESQLSSMRGSPLYMAPEMFANLDKPSCYDAKVDLWSVGVILYECLFGKAPYSSNSFKELIGKIKSQQKIEIPINSCVSKECTDLLHSLLQHDPADRMTHEEFFKHEFLDLKHIPSPENYQKAVALIQEAVARDANRDFEAAYHLYCESLRYFVPMVTEETNHIKKNALRNKVNCYIKRAEQLKIFTLCGDNDTVSETNIQNPTNNPANTTDKVSIKFNIGSDLGSSGVSFKKGIQSTDIQGEEQNHTVSSEDGTTDEIIVSETLPSGVDSQEVKKHVAQSKQKFEILYTACNSTKSLQTALEQGLAAEMYVREGRLEQALALYGNALSGLLSNCSEEPPGSRRAMLADKIDEWLQEAESIKALLETQRMEHDSIADAQRDYCCIQ